MNLLLVLFLTKVLADSDEDSRYVDLLPNEERNGFLDKIVSRIKKDVLSSDSRETSDDRKLQDDQNDFVDSMIEHEIHNRRKADAQKSEEDIDAKPFKTTKKLNKPTDRNKTNVTVSNDSPEYIKVDIVNDNVHENYKSNKKQEIKSNETSPTFVIRTIAPEKSLRRLHRNGKTTKSSIDNKTETQTTTDINDDFDLDLDESKDAQTDKIDLTRVKSEDETTTNKYDTTVPVTPKLKSKDDVLSVKELKNKKITNTSKMSSDDEYSSVEDLKNQSVTTTMSMTLEDEYSSVEEEDLKNQTLTTTVPTLSRMASEDEYSSIEYPKTQTTVDSSTTELSISDVKTTTDSYFDGQARASKETILNYPTSTDSYKPADGEIKLVDTSNDATNKATLAPTTELNKPVYRSNYTESDNKTKTLGNGENRDEDTKEVISESLEIENVDDLANITNRNTILLFDVEDFKENNTLVNVSSNENRTDETTYKMPKNLQSYVGGSENLAKHNNESRINSLRVNLQISGELTSEEELQNRPYQVYEILPDESPFIKKYSSQWPRPQSDESAFIQKHMPKLNFGSVIDESIKNKPKRWQLVPASEESPFLDKQPGDWHLEPKSDEIEYENNLKNYQHDHVQDEEPYYVPIYNYSPNKAYYNPANYLGPNAESIETGGVKNTQGHKEDFNSAVSDHYNNFNGPKDFDEELGNYNDHTNMNHKSPFTKLRYKSNEDSLNDNRPILNKINDYLDHLYDYKKEYNTRSDIKNDLKDGRRSKHKQLTDKVNRAYVGLYENTDDNIHQMQTESRKDIRKMSEILSFTPDADLVPVMLRLQSMKLPVRRVTSDIGTHISVLKDMINEHNSKLYRYDWLRSTVDIRLKIKKLMRIIDAVKREDNLHSADLEVLNYVIFLHNIAEDINLHGFATLRGFVPKPKKSNKGRVHIAFKGPHDRVWLIRKPRTRRANDSGLNKLQQFLEDLETNLQGLHTAIKKVTSLASYRNQEWFQNLKETYFTDDKHLQEVLLHLSIAKLCHLLEESTRSGAQDNYLKYVVKDKEKVKNILKEIVFAKKIMKK